MIKCRYFFHPTTEEAAGGPSCGWKSGRKGWLGEMCEGVGAGKGAHPVSCVKVDDYKREF